MPSLQPCSVANSLNASTSMSLEVDHFLLGDVLHHLRRLGQSLGGRFDALPQLVGIRPPTGCFTTISRGSILRAFAWARTSGLNVSVAIT